MYFQISELVNVFANAGRFGNVWNQSTIFRFTCTCVYLIRTQSQHFISFPASINRTTASENADNLALNCIFMGTFLSTFGYWTIFWIKEFHKNFTYVCKIREDREGFVTLLLIRDFNYIGSLVKLDFKLYSYE